MDLQLPFRWEHGIWHDRQLLSIYYEKNAIAWCTYIPTPEERTCWICSLYVSKSYRRQRLATKILYQISKLMAKQGINKLSLDDATDSGIDIYNKLGFYYKDPSDNEMHCRGSKLRINIQKMFSH